MINGNPRAGKAQNIWGKNLIIERRERSLVCRKKSPCSLSLTISVVKEESFVSNKVRLPLVGKLIPSRDKSKGGGVIRKQELDGLVTGGAGFVG